MGEGGWPGVDECIGENASGADGGVSRGAFRYETIVGKKFNSVDNAVCSGLRDVYSVVPIVFGGAADAPSGDAMGCPGVENHGGLRDKGFCFRRGKGRMIEVEGSTELGFS